MIIVGVNLNKKSYATTFILLLFFFSYRAALSRLEVTMFYYNFCFSQCYQCLALKYICTRLHNCFFFFLSLNAAVPKELVELHLKLMRKIGKSVTADRWEKYLIKVQYACCIILHCWNMLMMSCCVSNPWYEL